jgi:hypothetical protein
VPQRSRVHPDYADSSPRPSGTSEAVTTSYAGQGWYRFNAAFSLAGGVVLTAAGRLILGPAFMLLGLVGFGFRPDLRQARRAATCRSESRPGRAYSRCWPFQCAERRGWSTARVLCS